MKGITIFSILLVANICCLVFGQTNERVPSPGIAIAHQGSHDEDELLRLLKERRDAYYYRDIARFNRLEGSDLTRITEDGRLVTKEEQLAYMKTQTGAATPGEPIPVYADHDLKVRIHGDVAVITGRLTESGKSASGKDYNEPARFTEIWVKRKGAWQTVHNHYTTIIKR